MNRIISNGCHHTVKAHASSTTFLANVCQLVSTTASPKHPQSLIGLATAIHRVRGVIRSIISSTSSDTRRRRMAKSRQMPIPNSMADNRMEAPNDIKSGT